jgi:hypothetical protein
MTFTLFGRWQTRILLLAIVGLFSTVTIAIKSGTSSGAAALMTIAYLGVFGIIWDALYHQLQKFRWDGDWGGALQFLAAIWEGLFFIGAAKYIGLPGIDRVKFDLAGFVCFYIIICIVGYLLQTSLLKMLSPYSRFRGGQWF